MAKLKSFDPISGKEGVAYAKINGNNEELFFVKTIEASVEKAKSEIKAIGRRMTGHKTTGMSGSGRTDGWAGSHSHARPAVDDEA